MTKHIWLSDKGIWGYSPFRWTYDVKSLFNRRLSDMKRHKIVCIEMKGEPVPTIKGTVEIDVGDRKPGTQDWEAYRAKE